jgi:multiple sugar transport system permease protein
MRKLLHNSIILLLAALFFFPLISTLTNSFMTPAEIVTYYNNENLGSTLKYIRLIPEKFSLVQYYEILINRAKYLTMFWNSTKLSIIITLLHITISIPSAYVFAKIKFKGRDKLFFLYIVVMMMPYQVTLLPNYILSRQISIYNTDFAIIMPAIFAPFGVFLLRQFIKYIPDELLEAIKLESKSMLDILRLAVIPISKPGIISLFILTFSESWNMVEQPLVLFKDEFKYPLSIALNSIIKHAPDVAFASSVIYMFPILILYFFFEEKIIQGIRHVRF